VTRRFCDTRLGQVHVVEAGAGTATPLLLLHQTPRSVDEFAEALPVLAAARRVIAVDTPGYGCSDRVPGRPTIEEYAAAVVDVLDALALPRVIAVGHHTGAVIAVELAAAWPERIERVVLSGPVYTDAAGREALARHFRQWAPAADGSHLLAKWHKFSEWLPRPELVQRLVVDLFRAGETSEQGHYAVAAYRMEGRLPRVRCPALLLYAARDPFASPRQAAPLREAFRPCREASVEAGVFAATEAPGAWARAVLEYVGGPA
jgi:pimeloyl-ACP methyl ester carboxylesterase